MIKIFRTLKNREKRKIFIQEYHYGQSIMVFFMLAFWVAYCNQINSELTRIFLPGSVLVMLIHLYSSLDTNAEMTRVIYKHRNHR